MTVQEALIKGIKILNEGLYEESSLTARILLANILKIKKEELVINSSLELNRENQEEFFDDIYKVQKGYPIQYILGKKEFMKMDFFVNESVLIPRYDTEVLVEEVMKRINGKEDILELCTGSGAISISLAKYIDGLKITATDIKEDTLDVAKKNAKLLLKNGNITFKKSDMFENVNGKYDIIVSNPPYIKTEVIKEYALKYEPQVALDRADRMGLSFIEL